MHFCAKFKGFCRSAATLFLIASFLPVFAQTSAGNDEAKRAEALKLLTDANTLGANPEKESKLVAIEKLKTAEKLYEEVNDQNGLAGASSVHASVLFQLDRLDEAIVALDRSITIYKASNTASPHW